MLTIKNVSKSFVGNKILNNISLEISQSSIIGLAGSSGSGKSTLLRCIQGLETIEEGEIIYEGKAGFMFQDFQLFPHMNVLDNLTYAPKHAMKNSSYEKDAKELLAQLGLSEKASFFPHNLSGGQKQRVALARSLMTKPDLLLCDEPTSGLDVATIDEVVSLLKSVRQDQMTMIIASHDLDFLNKIADRIIVLKNGSIIADIETKEDNVVGKLKQYY